MGSKSNKTHSDFQADREIEQFKQTAHDPQATQNRLLTEILERNRTTVYGKEHGFSAIDSSQDYAHNVPIVRFATLEPYIHRIKQGEAKILTHSRPIRFNRTSGTTAAPKDIPVTQAGLDCIATRSRLWLYHALQDHSSFLNHSTLCIVGSSHEGETACGLPFGSASGAITQALPSSFKQKLVLPKIVTQLSHYDLRYYVMARLSWETNPSFVVTPNPATLLRLVAVAQRYQEEIIRSIHNGCLAYHLPFSINSQDRQYLDTIASQLQPNRHRARQLEKILQQHGDILPQRCWHNLQLIGCWLGGTGGFHAEALQRSFGERVPLRDIGYLASEGAMTIPITDRTPAGVLDLQSNFYEFIPRGIPVGEGSPTLQCHELKIGQQYQIILTNWNGLYRYDIQDIVEVQGFYHDTPRIAFVRKDQEFLNITGEKLHINHILETLRLTQAQYGLAVFQFRVITNLEQRRYDILLAIDSDVPRKRLAKTILPFLERTLTTVNLEYRAKRNSSRLCPPCLYLMDGTWSNGLLAKRTGQSARDAQLKWPALGTEWTAADREHCLATITMEELSHD